MTAVRGMTSYGCFDLKTASGRQSEATDQFNTPIFTLDDSGWAHGRIDGKDASAAQRIKFDCGTDLEHPLGKWRSIVKNPACAPRLFVRVRAQKTMP